MWKHHLPIGLLTWYHGFMSDAITVIPKKRRGPEPTGKGTPVMTRLQADLLEPLDKYISETDHRMSRPEALRVILKDWLIGNGYLKT